METAVYIGLLHYPVRGKDGGTITASITNLDLHDLARLARTFELKAFYVIQPLPLQRKLAERLAAYWVDGHGAEYNPTRKEAFGRMRIAEDYQAARAAIAAESGRPLVIGTSARPQDQAVSFGKVRAEMEKGGCWFILFGTGWGIAPEFLSAETDYLLEPIPGRGDYNHLPVRAAAAIILDRLLGIRE